MGSRLPTYLAIALLPACATGTQDGTTDSGVGSIAVDSGNRIVDASPLFDSAPGFDAAPVDAGLPVDAAPIDAAPPPIDAALPVDAGCVVQTVELLQNGFFDSGESPWVDASDGNNDLITSDDFGSSPHSGTQVAWLGGYNNGVDTVRQTIPIPAGATNLRLTGVVAVGSSETGSAVEDRSRVEIRSTGNAVLETLASYDNTDAPSPWLSLDLSPSGDYGGQTIRLVLFADNDNNDPTSFIYDTLSLTATACIFP